jgi:hypothetical protein
MNNKVLVIGALAAAVGFTGHAVYLFMWGGGESVVWVPVVLAIILYAAAMFVGLAVPKLKRRTGSWVQPKDDPNMNSWQKHRDETSRARTR